MNDPARPRGPQPHQAKRRSPWRLVAIALTTVTGVGGLAGLGAAVSPPAGAAVSPPAGAADVTTIAASFSPGLSCGSGFASSVTAPVGTTAASFTLYGGGGGGGDSQNGTDGGDGGDGAEVTGTIPLSGAQTVWASVGCGGHSTGAGGAGYTVGGAATDVSGGGGGGASALCLGSSSAHCGGGAVQVIAGGGGGGGAAADPGGACSSHVGGNGGSSDAGGASTGGAAGENGGAGRGGGAGTAGVGGDTGHDGGGGAGGTGTAPGQGGTAPGNDAPGIGGTGAKGNNNGVNGAAGPKGAPPVSGASGNGGASDNQNGLAGGGGGGGLAGGGGGGSGESSETFCVGSWSPAGGGGAGSSWALGGVSAATFSANSAVSSSCSATAIGSNGGVGAGTGGGDGCAGDVVVTWDGSAPAAPAPSTAAFTVDQAGSVRFTSAAAASYAETGALPSGLTFDAASGTLSGTPATGTVGSYPISVTATNPYGTSGADAATVDVGFATTTAAKVSPGATTSGDTVTYSASVSSSGGTPGGSVEFAVGTNVLCIGELASGTTSCTSTAAPVGDDTVTATYSGAPDFSVSAATVPLVVQATPGPYSPLPPVRICDTRLGNPSGLNGAAAQCYGKTLTAGNPLVVNVAGAFNVPTDATAVVLNVTAVDPEAKGYLTIYPAGQVPPTASNINFAAHVVTANLVETGISGTGQISAVSNVTTDVVIDLEGYVTESSLAGAGLYRPLSPPARICDTRPGNPSGLNGGAAGPAQCNGTGGAGTTLAAGKPHLVTVDGVGGVPATGVSAVVLNVTAVAPSAKGYLSVYPAGGTPPVASNLNFDPHQTVPNRVIVPVTSGAVDLVANVATDALVDVSGWFTSTGATSGAQLSAERTPVRICDTRAQNPSGLSGAAAQCNGSKGAGDPLGAGQTRSITVRGLAGVPVGATAVIVNVTAVSPTAQTHLTVFPGSSPPGVSDLNPAPGEVEANLVVAALSPTGTINLYNFAGSVNVVVDVDGWFSP